MPDSRRVLRASAALSFAYFAAIGVFNPYAPLWYASMGLPVVAIGLLVSLISWTRLFAPLLWGMVADRSGRRDRVLQAASLACLLASLGLFQPPTVLGLGVAVFLLYAFSAAFVPLNDAIIASELQAQGGAIDPRRYGRVRLWGSAGFLFTVWVGGWWFERMGMAVFPATMVAALLMLVLAAALLPRPARTQAVSHEAPPPLWPALRRPVVGWFFLALFFVLLAHVALYAFFSLYLDSLGYSKPQVGGLWAASVVVEIAWFALQGRWLRHEHLHRWLIAAALLTSLRFAGTALLGGQFWAVLLLQGLHAITFAAQHTACIGLLARFFPGRLQARGQALYAVLGYGVSGVLGSLGGAALAQRAGYAACFWAAAVAGLLGALCHWRCARLDRVQAPVASS